MSLMILRMSIVRIGRHHHRHTQLLRERQLGFIDPLLRLPGVLVILELQIVVAFAEGRCLVPPRHTLGLLEVAV